MQDPLETGTSVHPKKPDGIYAAQLLFIASAVIWLFLMIITLTRVSGTPGQRITALVIAIFMLGNAGAMAAAGVGIGKRKRIFFSFAVFVLLVNIILTFTDQFGLLDFITLAIDVVVLGLLIANRSYYTPAPKNAAGP